MHLMRQSIHQPNSLVRVLCQDANTASSDIFHGDSQGAEVVFISLTTCLYFLRGKEIRGSHHLDFLLIVETGCNAAIRVVGLTADVYDEFKFSVTDNIELYTVIESQVPRGRVVGIDAHSFQHDLVHRRQFALLSLI
jgi:hypothetical protein